MNVKILIRFIFFDFSVVIGICCYGYLQNQVKKAQYYFNDNKKENINGREDINGRIANRNILGLSDYGVASLPIIFIIILILLLFTVYCIFKVHENIEEKSKENVSILKDEDIIKEKLEENVLIRKDKDIKIQEEDEDIEIQEKDEDIKIQDVIKIVIYFVVIIIIIICYNEIHRRYAQKKYNII